jgi:hypothetical protein
LVGINNPHASTAPQDFALADDVTNQGHAQQAWPYEVSDRGERNYFTVGVCK